MGILDVSSVSGASSLFGADLEDDSDGAEQVGSGSADYDNTIKHMDAFAADVVPSLPAQPPVATNTAADDPGSGGSGSVGGLGGPIANSPNWLAAAKDDDLGDQLGQAINSLQGVGPQGTPVTDSSSATSASASPAQAAQQLPALPPCTPADAEADACPAYGRVAGSASNQPLKPSDVTQGALGDCFAESTLASAAQRDPQLIQNAIQINKDGTYNATLYQKQDNGEFQKVNLAGTTNDLPVDGEGNLVFGSGDPANPSDLRNAVAEKAIAQLYGGYDQIDGGYASGVMEALTGKPATELPLSSGTQDEVYNQLQSAIAQGQMTTAGTSPGMNLRLLNGTANDGTLAPLLDVNNDEYSDAKLATAHEYSVLGVGKDDTGQATVTLRNPWGYLADGETSTNGVQTVPLSQFSQMFDLVTIGGK